MSWCSSTVGRTSSMPTAGRRCGRGASRRPSVTGTVGRRHGSASCSGPVEATSTSSRRCARTHDGKGVLQVGELDRLDEDLAHAARPKRCRSSSVTLAVRANSGSARRVPAGRGSPGRRRAHIRAACGCRAGRGRTGAPQGVDGLVTVATVTTSPPRAASIASATRRSVSSSSVTRTRSGAVPEPEAARRGVPAGNDPQLRARALRGLPRAGQRPVQAVPPRHRAARTGRCGPGAARRPSPCARRCGADALRGCAAPDGARVQRTGAAVVARVLDGPAYRWASAPALDRESGVEVRGPHHCHDEPQPRLRLAPHRGL